jgi:hypothetical protein
VEYDWTLTIYGPRYYKLYKKDEVTDLRFKIEVSGVKMNGDA